jgi:hypothetical protein
MDEAPQGGRARPGRGPGRAQIAQEETIYEHDN